MFHSPPTRYSWLMTDIRRRVVNTAIALSLLLSIATSVLWVTSYLYPILRYSQFHGEACRIILNRGICTVDNVPHRLIINRLTQDFEQLTALRDKYTRKLTDLNARPTGGAALEREISENLSLLAQCNTQDAEGRRQLMLLGTRSPWSHSTGHALAMLSLFAGVFPVR